MQHRDITFHLAMQTLVYLKANLSAAWLNDPIIFQYTHATPA
jgi:hypothetical protein